nr:MAG TPA: hypothetical protein [Caudoviricetes sp.]
MSAAVWPRARLARRCSALRPSVALVACLEPCRSVSPLPCRLRGGGVLLPWCWACVCRRALRSRRASLSPGASLAPRRRWLAAAVGAARWRRDGVPPYGLRPRTLAPRLAASDGRAPASLATVARLAASNERLTVEAVHILMRRLYPPWVCEQRLGRGTGAGSRFFTKIGFEFLDFGRLRACEKTKKRAFYLHFSGRRQGARAWQGSSPRGSTTRLRGSTPARPTWRFP